MFFDVVYWMLDVMINS